VSEEAREVARALQVAGTVTLSLDEPVTFRSGLRSPVYVDNRRLIFHPDAWHVVVSALVARVAALAERAEVVAGVESAGIPHSSALAFAARLPSVFVRKSAKEHGLGRLVEGGDVAGRRVVLVEDMVSTGASSLSAIAALRGAGAVVSDCLAIIGYGFPGTAEAFAAARVRLGVLTTFELLVEEASAAGAVDARALATVNAWLADPGGWMPA
jgi:orotate phosphoribosyltransferase